eukprot:5587820-Prymnesium_polylepis.2
MLCCTAARARTAALLRMLQPIERMAIERGPRVPPAWAQPSLILCLRSGLVAKCNRPGAERVVHSAPINQPCAARDSNLARARAASRPCMLLVACMLPAACMLIWQPACCRRPACCQRGACCRRAVGATVGVSSRVADCTRRAPPPPPAAHTTRPHPD